MNKRRLLVIAVLAVIVVIAVSVAVVLLLSPKELQCGYTEMEGFLELRAYPRISDSVPDVMVYVVVPMDEQLQIYLTEDGMPISSLEGFGENDSVIIEGVVYGRQVFGVIGSYWMLEVFAISEGDQTYFGHIHSSLRASGRDIEVFAAPQGNISKLHPLTN